MENSNAKQRWVYEARKSFIRTEAEKFMNDDGSVEDAIIHSLKKNYLKIIDDLPQFNAINLTEI